MKQYFIYIVALLVACVGFATEGWAQNMPERGLVRKGNRQFANQRYEQSADSYQQALVYDSTSFAAKYNLGSAMFRTERYDRAEQLLSDVVADSLQSDADRAEAYFNLGNAQFAQQKLQEALQSYRRSLTLNPDDLEAKYNYAYTKKLIEQQQQQQNQDQNQDQNNQDNQDNQENQENQNDQNQNQNQDQQDNNQNQDNKDNQNNPDNQNQNQDKQGQQPPRSGMSEQQQQQLLNAIQAQEDKTQEKLDEKAKGVIIKGRKNW